MQPKPLWESKTFWVNILAGILLIANDQQVISIVPPKYTPLLTAGLAAINIVLRMVTSQPVTLTPPKP